MFTVFKEAKVLMVKDDIELFHKLLSHAQYGVVYVVDNKVEFKNITIDVLFNDIPSLLNDILAFDKLRTKMVVNGRISMNYRHEFHLIDKYRRERYLSIDVVSRRNSSLITITESTEQYLSGLIDPLTKLGNRLMFEQKANLYKYDTTVFPISILQGDVNGLKLANDVFGYTIGDKLLVSIANIISANIRLDSDIACRWGGDEFIIILPNTTEKDAKMICNRISNACHEAKANPIKPSISIGHATQENKDELIEDVLRRAESVMRSVKLTESQQHRFDIMNALKDLMIAKSSETLKHCERLGKLLNIFSDYLGVEKEERDTLSLLAHWHDIGNAAIDNEILMYTGEYTDVHREAMQEHVTKGYMAVKAVPEYACLAIHILHHHENWDGTGYLSGIAGDEISKFARILSILDTYERITTKQGLTKEAHNMAVQEIYSLSGTRFDPMLVDKFMEIADSFENIK